MLAATKQQPYSHSSTSASTSATTSSTANNNTNKNVSLTLRLIGGEEEPRVRKIRLPCTVGRLQADCPPAANNAVFLSEYLSRRHAEFFSDPTGQVYIKDLNSSNGTFLNGNQLKGMQPVLLQENDIIQFGTEDEDVERESVVIVQIQLPTPSVAYKENHYNNHGSSSSNNKSDYSPPIYYNKVQHHKKTPLVDAQMSSQQRLTDVMRKLSTLGMQMNTGGSGMRVDGSLLNSRLTMIEDAVEACLNDCDGSNTTMTADDTIHTRPTLKAALNIITVYETVFMLMAAVLVFYWST